MPGALQEILEVEDIKEGVVILKDKSLRGILAVSSMNFALKSEEEQTAIIYQFQNFLNSLDFPLQILVQSRRINLTGYIEELKALEEKQPNELLRMQTADYRKFIESLVQKGTIMTKNFYVIVPFYFLAAKTKKKMTSREFEEAKIRLFERMEYVTSGLKRCGLQCAPLGTQELIDLFWSHYHPEEAEVGYHPAIPPELIT